jgi:hypothetical protein
VAVSRAAIKFLPIFRVLALFAPFAGNVPTDYLLKNSTYDTDTFALFPSCEYKVELLKNDAQVVLNLISDADQASALLPLAVDLVARIGKPVVNHPARIRRTTRDAVAVLQDAFSSCSTILARPVGPMTVTVLKRSEAPCDFE